MHSLVLVILPLFQLISCASREPGVDRIKASPWRSKVAAGHEVCVWGVTRCWCLPGNLRQHIGDDYVILNSLCSLCVSAPPSWLTLPLALGEAQMSCLKVWSRTSDRVLCCEFVGPA